MLSIGKIITVGNQWTSH